MTYSDIYNNWLSDERLNGEAEKELENIKDDKKEIEYRFGAELEFGTAGMRGIIGYGTNMMNIYTVKNSLPPTTLRHTSFPTFTPYLCFRFRYAALKRLRV